MKQTTIVAVVLASAFGLVFAMAEKMEPLAPKLSIDGSEPLRTGPRGGYADVVETVGPSVVSVFTSREATSARGNAPDMRGFFDSPMFREFFGDRGREMPRGWQNVPRSAPQREGLGSGVILSADGYVLTNNHVVASADKIKVRLSDGDEHVAELIATDPASDLAVIKIEATDLPAATLGDSSTLRAGDFVLAIGSPFGLTHTVTSGIVSAIGRNNLDITGYENFIQTDASINPGNSGGALIDSKGRVVGINTAIFSRSGGNVGIGFAIPVNMAIDIAGELIDTGEISRGYLGISMGPLTEELAEALDVKAEGVVVNDVMPKTPAARAGFEAGDVIVAVDGELIENSAELRFLVGGTSPGEEVDFKVRRGDKEMTLTAEIAEIPENMLSAAAGPQKSESDVIEDGSLAGVRLGTLDSETRERLELAKSVKGVVVLEVTPDSKAAEAGLQPGNVITEINRETVTSPKEAYDLAASRGEKATLLRVTDGKLNRFLAIG
ncbi:MAG: DegQ family serine endoprotease [Verrucomicrobiota bacterium]